MWLITTQAMERWPYLYVITGTEDVLFLLNLQHEIASAPLPNKESVNYMD
jgi:hypothetical protein